MGSILGATQNKLLGDLLQNLVLVSTAIIDCQSMINTLADLLDLMDPGSNVEKSITVQPF